MPTLEGSVRAALPVQFGVLQIPSVGVALLRVLLIVRLPVAVAPALTVQSRFGKLSASQSRLLPESLAVVVVVALDFFFRLVDEFFRFPRVTRSAVLPSTESVFFVRFVAGFRALSTET
jgi:hypothetical protein